MAVDETWLEDRASRRGMKVARRVSRDRECSRCGYNLIGLDRDGVCPECGLPVAMTSGWGVMSTGELSRLKTAAALLGCGYAGLALTTFAAQVAPVSRFSPGAARAVQIVALGVDLAAAVAMWMGIAVLAMRVRRAADDGHEGPAMHGALAWSELSRLGALAGGLGWPAFVTLSAVAALAPLDEAVLRGVSAVAWGALAIGAGAMFITLRAIADLMHRAGLAVRQTLVGQWAALAAGASMSVYAAVTLLGGGGAPDALLAALLYAAQLGLIAGGIGGCVGAVGLLDLWEHAREELGRRREEQDAI